MQKVILMSNGCPRCRTLKQMLNQKSIPYTEENSVSRMLDMGIEQVPVLLVDDAKLDYNQAVAWANKWEAVNEKQ